MLINAHCPFLNKININIANKNTLIMNFLKNKQKTPQAFRGFNGDSPHQSPGKHANSTHKGPAGI